MLAPQRHTLIVDRVRRDGAVRVAELVRELGVSDMTIRRDLDLLARRGLLDKVHGGATLPRQSTSAEPWFSDKSRREPREKEAIALAASELVVPGSAIGLSAGSTTCELARALADVPGLTVVTNSPPAAQVLHQLGRLDLTVVLTGGQRTRSDALVGPIANACLDNVRLDAVFLGIHGMHRDAGFTSPNLWEAETDRMMIACSSRRVFLADHTKWDVTGLAFVSPLETANVLITDSGLDPAAREVLAESVGELKVVDVGSDDTADQPVS